jgi:hypothetical protein
LSCRYDAWDGFLLAARFRQIFSEFDRLQGGCRRARALGLRGQIYLKFDGFLGGVRRSPGRALWRRKAGEERGSWGQKNVKFEVNLTPFQRKA